MRCWPRPGDACRWSQRLADSALGSSWVAGGSDHGGACLRRVMFITRRRTLRATPLRHCPACPGRTMYAFGHCLYCRREMACAAILKGTSLHADKLRGGGEIGLGVASGFEPSLDGDKLRRGGKTAWGPKRFCTPCSSPSRSSSPVPDIPRRGPYLGPGHSRTAASLPLLLAFVPAVHENQGRRSGHRRCKAIPAWPGQVTRR